MIAKPHQELIYKALTALKTPLCFLVSSRLQIKEMDPETALIFPHLIGQNLTSLWGKNRTPFSEKIEEIIADVFKSKEPRIEFQYGIVPIISNKDQPWQCSFFPVDAAQKLVLIKLENISHLIEMNPDLINLLEASKNKTIAKYFNQKKEADLKNRLKLKFEEERFHLLVDNIKDYAIFMLDAKGNIATWNKGAEVIKQYKAEEVIGKHFSIFYTKDALEKNHPQKELEIAIKNGRYEEEGLRIKKDGSTFWANVVITPVYNNNKKLIGFGKITRDLSERRKIEKIKNEFISVISHELRTPLTSIKGSISLLQESSIANESEKNKNLLNIAYSNCERLTRLINDVLDIEKIKDGYMIFNNSSYNLRELIEEAISLNEIFAQKYKVNLAPHDLVDATVYVDADRLLQVLTNLISNAVKFSPKNKAVTITMKKDRRSVCVAVTDRGPGVPAEFRDNVFERFSQADSSNTRKIHGTGLGLAISKAIIDQLHGALNFSSVQGKTTFYFKIPLIDNSPATRPLKNNGLTKILIYKKSVKQALYLQTLLRTRENKIELFKGFSSPTFNKRKKYDIVVLDLNYQSFDLLSNPKLNSLNDSLVIFSLFFDKAHLLKKIPVTERFLKNIITKFSIFAMKNKEKPSKLKILYIESNDKLCQLMQDSINAKVTFSNSLLDAQKILDYRTFDFIVLSITLPDGIWYELIPFILDKKTTVVLISSLDYI